MDGKYEGIGSKCGPESGKKALEENRKVGRSKPNERANWGGLTSKTDKQKKKKIKKKYLPAKLTLFN